MRDVINHHRPKTNPFLRLLFMIILYVLFVGVRTVIILLSVFQYFSHLLTGRVSVRVIRWGEALSRWIYDFMRFLSYNSERMPFPFAALSKNGDFDS